MSLVKLSLCIVERYIETLRPLRRDFKHGIHHHRFNDGPQPAGAKLILHSLIDDEVEGFFFKRQLHPINGKQLLILLDDRVFRLNENPPQRSLVQWIQISENR